MSSSTPPATVVQRRHTSPQAKWLLNEAAALRGELLRIAAKREQLDKREAKVRKTLAALELVAAPLPVPTGVSAPLVVLPHHRYGERGQLTTLLLERLRVALPKGVDIHTLVDWVAGSYGIQFASMAERNEYRRSVRTRLFRLSEQGRVERLWGPGSRTNDVSVWRLVSKNSASLEELGRLRDAASEPNTEGGV